MMAPLESFCSTETRDQRREDLLWVLRWDTQIFRFLMEGRAEKQKVFLQASLKEKKPPFISY